MYQRKTLLALLFATACTPALTPPGSGESSETSAPVAVASFADGSGVLRADFTEAASAAAGDVTKVVAYTDDVNAWIEDLTIEDIESLKASGFIEAPEFDPIVPGDLQSLITAKYGYVTIAGDIYEVYVIETTNGDGIGIIGVKYLDVGSYGPASALAIGSKASNIPSGTYTYTGINIFGKGTGGSYLTNGIGDFTLSVNFGDGTGSLVANTSMLNTTSLSGNVTIDVSRGEFSGTNLALGGTSGGVSLNGMTADLEGSFHGNGATDVTALYYTENLNYGGVLVGSQQ